MSSVSIEHVACDTLLPINTDSNRSPLLFNVNSSPNHVVDTRNIKIHCSFVLQKFDKDEWKGLANTDKACVYNNFGFGLFEDVHLCVNGVLVEGGDREYGRSSYLKNLLFSDGSKSLQSALYFEDNPGQMEVVLASTSNPCQWTRWSAGLENNECTFIAPVYLDILQADGVFPENVSFTLRFFPTRSECCIEQSADPAMKLRAVIKHAELLVPRCKLSVPKQLTVPYEATKVITFLNPKTITHFTRSLNLPELPSKILLGVLDEKKFKGDAIEHSYFFGHNDVKRVEVHCNGQTYPSQSGIVIFSKPPAENLVVYVICFFDSKFTIDSRAGKANLTL